MLDYESGSMMVMKWRLPKIDARWTREKFVSPKSNIDQKRPLWLSATLHRISVNDQWSVIKHFQLYEKVGIL